MAGTMLSPDLITLLAGCLDGSSGSGSVVEVIAANDEIGLKLFTVLVHT